MFKRKDGVWQDKIKNGDKWKYFYGQTRSEVLEKERRWQQEALASPNKDVSFETVAERWWDYHEPTLERNTVRSYAPAYKRALEFFKGLMLRNVTAPVIKKRIDEFSVGKSQKTAATQLLVIRLILNYAVQYGYINENAAREVRIPKNLPKKKVHALDDKQMRIIVRNINHPFGMYPYMLLYTGMRKCEALALTWEDVSMDSRTISVNKSLYYDAYGVHVKQPKTESGERTIPIPDALYDKLEASEGIIFKGKGGGYVGEHEFDTLWKGYCRDTGFKGTPHQIRHTYATMLYELGIQAKDASSILGHAQVSTTMDIYTEIRKEKRGEVAKSISKMVAVK